MVSSLENWAILLPRPVEPRNNCTSKAGLLDFAFLGGGRTLMYASRVEEDMVKLGLGPKGRHMMLLSSRGAPIAVDRVLTWSIGNSTFSFHGSVLQME